MNNNELGLIETIGKGHKDIKIFGVQKQINP